MARDEQAIKPVFNISSYIKEEKKTDVETLTEDEKTLGYGAKQKFWKVLREHIENEIDNIDKIAEDAIESGAPMEEIGRNTIVVSQVKGVLKRIFNIVEDSYEATKNK